MRAKLKTLSVAIATIVSIPNLASAKEVNQQDYVKELFKSAKKVQVQTLSDAALKAKKLVGAAVNEGVLLSNEEAYLSILDDEYDYVTPENSGKWGPLQPAPGEWDFSTHDQVVDYANLSGKLYKGHTLVWHSQAPSFINGDLSPEELSGYINDHISTTVDRYTGQFYGWDVVNEAIDEDGSYRDSVLFQKLGTSYIADAFYATNALDPKAHLYYNDYNIAHINAKSDGVYALLQGLRDEGVPVDGIGFQMHLTANNAPGYDELVGNFQRFVDLGLHVAVTELDVRINDLPWEQATDLALQQQVYHTVVAACMQFNKCESITTWGLTDNYSWIDSTFGEDDPLPFDESYARKPAFYGMIDGFMGIVPELSATPNLIANGQFEAGADLWSVWGGEISRVAIKDFNPDVDESVCPDDCKLDNAGESALLVSNRTEAWHAAVYDVSEIVLPGMTYTGAAFAKLANADSDDVTLSATYRCEDDSDSSYVNLATATTGNIEWTGIAGEFTLPECTIANAAIYVQGPAAGVDFLIDKVSLKAQNLAQDTAGLGDNIIPNGDFEVDGSGWYGFGDATITTSADFAVSGAQSGIVSNRLATWQGPATNLENTEPGTDYRLFAWVRSAVEPVQINATLLANCASGSQFNFITSTSADANGWSIISGEFTVPDCDASGYTLYFEGPAEGVEFYIDDVSVRQVLASAIPSTNLVSNGDFENGTSNWVVWGGTLTTTTTNAYEGASALHSGRTGTWQGPVYNLLPKVVAGEEYSISAFARVAGEGITSENMNITVKTVCASGDEAFNWGGGATLSTDAWTQISGSVVLPDCELTEVSLYFDGPAVEADILLDNVVVEGATVEPSDNLVTNPGFETGLAGWIAWGGTLGVSTDAHSGSQSVIHTDRTGTWQGPVYSLLGSVEAGSTYDFSVWGKVSGSASESMNITVKTVCDDGTEAFNWVGSNTVTDSDWSEISGSLTMPSCTLTEVSLYFDGPAIGVDSLVDDVSVIAAP